MLEDAKDRELMDRFVQAVMERATRAFALYLAEHPSLETERVLERAEKFERWMTRPSADPAPRRSRVTTSDKA